MEMNHSEVKERVLPVIYKELVLPEDMKIEEDDDLINDLGADELDVISIILALEEKFDIAIPEKSCIEIKEVKDMIFVVEQALGKKNG
jgi:acyl carrier protein